MREDCLTLKDSPEKKIPHSFRKPGETRCVSYNPFLSTVTMHLAVFRIAALSSFLIGPVNLALRVTLILNQKTLRSIHPKEKTAVHNFHCSTHPRDQKQSPSSPNTSVG